MNNRVQILFRNSKLTTLVSSRHPYILSTYLLTMSTDIVFALALLNNPSSAIPNQLVAE